MQFCLMTPIEEESIEIWSLMADENPYLLAYTYMTNT